MNRKTFGVRENSSSEKFPSFNKPAVVGYFSVDSNRCYCSDLKQLKYISFPESNEVKFDLDVGRNRAVFKDENVDEKLDHILLWMKENFRNKEWVTPDFVCFRGLLNTLLGTPFEKQDGWIICATKWKGSIYLCAKETDEKRRQRQERTDRDMQFLSWGFKFEQYMCSDKPDGVPDTAPPVDQREELGVMFRTKLSSHRLLFGAEMDGVRSKTKIENCAELASAEFVELKTSREIENARQNSNFRRYKLVKWWGQSFLVGINHLVCGFRDDRGVVHRLQHYKVADFPKMAKDMWDPCACMTFCDRFLQFVKDLVTEDDPSIVWCFEWKPHQDVTTSKIMGPSDLAILPQWFISSFTPEDRQ